MWAKRTDKRLAVLDLPQIYTKPSGTELLQTLALLTIKPRSFGTNAHEPVKSRTVESTGLTRYLTSIVASPLSWLDTDELREAIWDAAAARLSERSGRTGVYTSRKLSLRSSEYPKTDLFPTSNAGDVSCLCGSYILWSRVHVDPPRTLIDVRQPGHEDLGFIVSPLPET